MLSGVKSVLERQRHPLAPAVAQTLAAMLSSWKADAAAMCGADPQLGSEVQRCLRRAEQDRRARAQAQRVAPGGVPAGAGENDGPGGAAAPGTAAKTPARTPGGATPGGATPAGKSPTPLADRVIAEMASAGKGARGTPAPMTTPRTAQKRTRARR